MEILNTNFVLIGIIIGTYALLADSIGFVIFKRNNLKIKEWNLMFHYKFKLHSTKTLYGDLNLGWIPLGGSVQPALNSKEKTALFDPVEEVIDPLVEEKARSVSWILLAMTIIVSLAIALLATIKLSDVANYFSTFFDYVFSFSKERKASIVELTKVNLAKYNPVLFISVVHILLFMFTHITSIINKYVIKSKIGESIVPFVILAFAGLLFVKLVMLTFSMATLTSVLWYAASFFAGIAVVNVLMYFVLRFSLKRA